MPQHADAEQLRDFLARATRRFDLLGAASGAAAGLAASAVLALLGWPASGAKLPTLGSVAVLVFAGAATAAALARARRNQIAELIERRVPAFKNVLVTASELLRTPRTAERTADSLDDEYVSSIVLRAAARILPQVELSKVFPAQRVLAAVGLSVAVWLTAAALTSAAPPGSSAAGAFTTSIDGVDFTITAPAYSGRPERSVRDAARIEALVGSTLKLNIRARAATLKIETLHGTRSLNATPQGTFTAELTADADGFIAIEPLTADGRAGARRLIGLSVSVDAPPRVRIAAPGRDIFLKDGRQSLDVALEADDDMGLASLRLKYTRVSGSGERFSFAEGEVPLQITRTDTRRWQARVTWRLAPLALEAGDMVVYRAVAADQRPGATAVESDSYIAEVVALGGVAAAGFALDPEQERYAVSQQMVILKTERLLARRASLTPEAFAAEAADIGGEQRKVRAEFVFMMGGEMADGADLGADLSSLDDLNEEAEAAGEEDLLAGRMENAGRMALLRAIRAMSRAAAALNVAQLPEALPHEKVALVQLERAFARTRIILRTLTQREQLDFTRRMTGTLTEASRSTRPVESPVLLPRTLALRALLSEIATLAGSAATERDGTATASATGTMTRTAAAAAASASLVAQRVLQVDPSDKALQETAARLNDAAGAFGGVRPVLARAFLDRAATRLAGAMREALARAPRDAGPIGARVLDGALNAARRDRRGVP